MLLEQKEFDTINKLIESIEPSQFKGLTTKIKYLYPSIYNKLYNKKIELNIKTFSEILYLAINEMIEKPKCPICNKNLNFKSLLEGYFPYCKVCVCNTDDFILKRKETNIARYGVEYPTKNKSVLDKIKKTNLSRYGVKNVKQIKN